MPEAALEPVKALVRVSSRLWRTVGFVLGFLLGGAVRIGVAADLPLLLPVEPQLLPVVPEQLPRVRQVLQLLEHLLSTPFLPEEARAM